MRYGLDLVWRAVEWHFEGAAASLAREKQGRNALEI